MSFLDNLENNLKTMEGREEGGVDDRARRDADLKEAKAAAPWAEKLKTAVWTKHLMSQATQAGYGRRLKVNLIWIGTTLRLEARGLRLELRPTPNGVRCVFLKGYVATGEVMLQLEGDPRELVSDWMRMIDEEVISTLPPDVEEIES